MRAPGEAREYHTAVVTIALQRTEVYLIVSETVSGYRSGTLYADENVSRTMALPTVPRFINVSAGSNAIEYCKT